MIKSEKGVVDMTRAEVIELLKSLCTALNMAIASLETDEAYQLEYERSDNK